MVTNEQLQDLIEKTTRQIIDKEGYAFATGVLMERIRQISYPLKGKDREHVVDILSVHVDADTSSQESA